MEKKNSNHDLREFAEQRLKEHIEELNTHYQGKTMPSKDEKTKAFETHYNMFSAELEEKNKELGDDKANEHTIKEYLQKFKKDLPQ